MFEYTAVVTAIHDGDTVALDIDLGFDVHAHHPVRFFGINAPELATPEGKEATAYLKTLISVGDPVTVVTRKGRGFDKYGRYLGTLTVVGSNYGSLNDLMVSSGHAKAWDGKGAKPV